MKIDRLKIYEKYDGHCAYCGEKIKMDNWHIDHIEPVLRDIYTKKYDKEKFDVEENLNPSCRSCNVIKNSFTLEQFRENVQNFVNSLNSHSTQYKFAKKYNLIKETDKKVKFYFETHGVK